MRVHFALAVLAVFVCLLSIGLGQEVQTGPAARFQRGQRASAAPQPQRAGRLVSVEVVIADVTGGEDRPLTAERLAELEKGGQVTSLSRLRLSALENQPAVVQFGERVSLVTGRTSLGGRGAQDMMAQENLGTMVSVTARVEDDQSIVMEFQAEQTRFAPAAARAEGDNIERPAELPRTAKITAQSTLRIEPGKSVVAGGKTTRTEQGTMQTWILVSATAEPARPKAADEAATLKVFTLMHAKAESLAELIQTVFRGDDLHVAADTRSNCLIVPGDDQTLDMIQRLLTRLDEPAPPASN